ncbi:MAG: outer membrane beta-barrel protein [Bacteroidales bacterium]|jgi:hypothetical protein|nr:outer membrane beta-barrel protein [Bacteroidales bacterium]
MKKVFTLLFIAFMVQISFAQEDNVETKDDMTTIFTKENFRFTGGYLAPDFKVGDVHEDISMLVGIKLGFTFNDKFSIGLAGYNLVNNSNFYAGPELASINMGYGGLSVEYSMFSNKIIHFTIPVVVGAGSITLYEDNDNDNLYNFNYFDEIESTTALVVEPGVNIEVNLFKILRVDLGASYRLVSGTDLVNLTDEHLTDLSFNATLKFGIF